MFSYIYYSLGILVLLSLIKIIFNIRKNLFVKEWYYKFQKITLRKPQIIDFRSKNDYNLYLSWSLIFISDSIWSIVGIFSSNFIFFFISIILNVYFISENEFKHSFLGKSISFILIFIKIIIYTSIIFLFFSEKIDLSTWILRLV